MGGYSRLCPVCLSVCPTLPPAFALICSLLRPQTLFSPPSTPKSPSRARCTPSESPRSRPGRRHPPAAAVRAPPVPVPTARLSPPAPGFWGCFPAFAPFRSRGRARRQLHVLCNGWGGGGALSHGRILTSPRSQMTAPGQSRGIGVYGPKISLQQGINEVPEGRFSPQHGPCPPPRPLGVPPAFPPPQCRGNRAAGISRKKSNEILLFGFI